MNIKIIPNENAPAIQIDGFLLINTSDGRSVVSAYTRTGGMDGDQEVVVEVAKLHIDDAALTDAALSFTQARLGPQPGDIVN